MMEMPHGFCYLWNEPLIWLHVGSDLLIGASYVIIAAALITLRVIFSKQVKATGFSLYFYLFGAFIFCCALTHFVAIITVYEAWFWFDGVVKAITAIVSAVTAVSLFRLLRTVLKNHIFEVPITTTKSEPFFIPDVPKSIITPPPTKDKT